ncbi:MAG: tetratricopeptide repeat protein, partial [Clostridia bacterium]|nr:tetratricopeptide repeat protein [Clostridia bacterium]
MKKNKSVARVIKVAETFSGDTQKQIRELKKCVREGRKTGDIFMMGIAYYFLAEASSDTDDLHGMLTNALKAVTLLKDTGEYEFTALAYTVLGHAYTNQGNNQMSLVCDEAAYELVKRHRIKGKTRIRALNSLSVSYHLMEETSKSVKCLNECIELLKRDYAEDYTDLFMYSLNLASCNKDIGELELARDILASLSGMVEKVDFLPIVCDYYLRSAIISFMLEDVAAGNGFMDAAFGIFPKNVYPLPLYDDLCEVSRIISKNGDKVRAGKIFDIMKVYAENNGGTLEQLFATLMMASYYKDFGEYRLAAEYYAKYEELNEKQTRELKEMQMKLHYTTRNTEIEIKRLKRKMRKNEELASIEPLTGLLNRS